jgi:hypothetical protein
VNRRFLKAVLPPVDDERYWSLTLNHLFGCQKDALFRWLQDVRKYVEKAEQEKGRAA